MKATAITSLLLAAPAATSGFVAPKNRKRPSSVVSVVSSELEDSGIPNVPGSGVPDATKPLQSNDDDDDDCLLPTQKGKKMSESIPFLKCPPVLMESDLAGNVGFDPLGFATNKDQLMEYREAEIKHARLAMLAAIGWPLSELEDRNIADYFHVQSVLDESDRVPSILNGGLDRIDPRFWGFCLGMSAAIDMYGVSKARKGDAGYYPGNLGFDPLNLFPPDREGQETMKLAEIKHGRVAMLGVMGYVVEEYLTKMAVVDDTPILFQPITETVEEAIESVEGVIETVEEVISSTFLLF